MLSKRKILKGKNYLKRLQRNTKKQKNIHAYNLASIYSLLDQLSECKKYLELARDKGRILPKKRVEEDPDLTNVRDKEEEWFKKFLETLNHRSK